MGIKVHQGKSNEARITQVILRIQLGSLTHSLYELVIASASHDTHAL